MAENGELPHNVREEPESNLEMDSICTTPGDGFVEGASSVSGYKFLQSNPPDQSGTAEGGRLVSSIIRDGRFGTNNNAQKLEEFMDVGRRAMADMKRMEQMFQELHAEYERLRGEPGFCRNCRLSLSLAASNNERSEDENDLQKELNKARTMLMKAETTIEQLQNRCRELLDEVARLKEGSADVEPRDRGEPRQGNMAAPEQTDSVGNAMHSIDPLIEAAREGRKECEVASEERVTVEERVKPPSPEECANFLADHVSSSSIKTLLRNMNLTSVQIADLEERHPRAPLEYRIEGIRTGISSARGDRITFLLDSLEKSELIYQMELLCDEFNIPLRARKAQHPMQASTEEDFADSPCLEPQSDFEAVLQAFMENEARLHDVALEVRKELDFTPGELRKFIASFPSQDHQSTLKKECVSRCTMDVLNVWASIELKRRREAGDPAKGFEILASALRKAERTAVLVKLQSFLRKGLMGPALARDVYLRSIKSYLLKQDLILHLGIRKERHDDWRGLAEHIGYGKFIQAWEQRDNPGELVWNTWQTRNDATVGNLYNWAVSHGRLDIAAILEQE